MHRFAASSSSAASSAEQPATVSSSSIRAEQPPTSLCSAAQPASSAEQPAASLETSSSAAQPASERSKLSTSGSAARPATLLEKVEQLGHYPKRCKNPNTDKERAENSLAKQIAKQWSKLSDTIRAELTRLKQPATLSEQVEQLGHYPKRCKNPGTDKERAENSLAKKISMDSTSLSDATKAELTRIEEEKRGKAVEARADRRASDILQRLRAFGKRPQEHAYSQASDPDIIAEAQLAHDLRK